MKQKIHAYQQSVFSTLDAYGMKEFYTKKKAELEEKKKQHKDIQQRYEAAKNALAEIITLAKSKKEQAIREIESHHIDYDESNPNFYECGDDGAPPKELRELVWDALSDEQGILQAEIEQLKNEVDATSNLRDKSVIQEFETTKLAFIEATKKLDSFKERASAGEKYLDAQIAKWRNEVDVVVSKINFHFQKLMKGMKCDGGVKFSDPADFKKAGIEISVKFHEGDGITQLSAGSNSGGERAVSTIMYLLAVQQMAPAPLRMVDEINQGMDAKNERHCYNAVGNITSTDQGKTQFWLFSPKLLMNEKRFKYPEDITVLLVQGGPHMIPSRDWDMDKIIAAERTKKTGVKRIKQTKQTGKKRKSPDQGSGGKKKRSRATP